MSDSSKTKPEDQRSILASQVLDLILHPNIGCLEEITARIEILMHSCNALSSAIFQANVNRQFEGDGEPYASFLLHCEKELRLLNTLIEQTLQDRVLGELEASSMSKEVTAS